MKKNHIPIDLIPQSHRLPPAVSLDHLIIGLLLVIAAVGGLNMLNENSRVDKMRSRFEQIKAQQGALDKKIADLRGDISINAAKKEQQSLVQKIIGEKLPWDQVFKELGMVIPATTWLTDFIAERKNGKLLVALRGETASQANMANFYASLEKSEYFSNVLMVSSHLTEDTNPALYTFKFASPKFENKLKALKKD